MPEPKTCGTCKWWFESARTAYKEWGGCTSDAANDNILCDELNLHQDFGCRFHEEKEDG